MLATPPANSGPPQHCSSTTELKPGGRAVSQAGSLWLGRERVVTELERVHGLRAGQLEAHELDFVLVDLLEGFKDGLLPLGKLADGRLELVLWLGGHGIGGEVLRRFVGFLSGDVGLIIGGGSFLFADEERFLDVGVDLSRVAAVIVDVLVNLGVAARLLLLGVGVLDALRNLAHGIVAGLTYALRADESILVLVIVPPFTLVEVCEEAAHVFGGRGVLQVDALQNLVVALGIRVHLFEDLVRRWLFVVKQLGLGLCFLPQLIRHVGDIN